MHAESTDRSMDILLYWSRYSMQETSL